MKVALSVVSVLVIASGAPGEEVQLKNEVQLGLSGVHPAKLSPDGKRVLFLKRRGPNEYSYWVVGVDGNGAKKVFDSSIEWEDLFTSCFGRGVWSPDGRQFAALTTHNGKGYRQGGNPVMVVCDLSGRTTGLPCDAGSTWGALFGSDRAVYYVDMPSLKRRELRSTLKRFDPNSGAVKELLKYGDKVVTCTTMTPDRRRIGGILMGNKDGRNMRLWAYDVARGKTSQSEPVVLDDYLYGGSPWVFWADGGKALYSTARDDAESKGSFSIVRFEPFIPTTQAAPRETELYEKWIAQLGSKDWQVRSTATRKLQEAGRKALGVIRKALNSDDPEVVERAKMLAETLSEVRRLQKGKSLAAACELKPGLLSVKSSRSAHLLDVAKDELSGHSSSLLLIDRRNAVGLFLDLKSRTLWTAKVLTQ